MQKSGGLVTLAAGCQHVSAEIQKRIQATLFTWTTRLTGPFCSQSKKRAFAGGMPGAVGRREHGGVMGPCRCRWEGFRWVWILISLRLSLGLICYSGPLNWLPERCCLTDSFDPAASPSFLHTTCEQKRREEELSEEEEQREKDGQTQRLERKDFLLQEGKLQMPTVWLWAEKTTHTHTHSHTLQ